MIKCICTQQQSFKIQQAKRNGTEWKNTQIQNYGKIKLSN